VISDALDNDACNTGKQVRGEGATGYAKAKRLLPIRRSGGRLQVTGGLKIKM